MTNGSDELIYLDHAATSWPKADGVTWAMAEAVELGNPGRGGHRLSRAAAAVADRTRAALAGVLGEADPARVVFTAGCTDSIHTAIVGAVSACERDERGMVPGVVVSGVEHNAVTRTVAALERAGRVRMVEVPVDASTRVDPEAVVAACDERTRLVCVLHASNVTGVVQPVEAIGALLRERWPGAMLMVDAAQTVGAMPLDVRGLGADLLAFGSHKGLRGPTGIGGLWVGKRAWVEGVRRIVSVRQGGTGTASEGDAMPDVLPLAFESGSANLPAIAGLGAAVGGHDPEAIGRTRELARVLLETLRERLGDALTVYAHERGSDFADALPTIAMNLAGWDAGDLAEVLDASFGIAVRAGLHCSPRCHRAMGTLEGGGCLRVSLGSTTSEDDARRLVGALVAVAGSA
ncbi:MAG: aminotransferase class V-fold PLP-dependent enzyme [Phycisphaerales bacterium JB050]